MNYFILRTDKATNEVRGILIYENPADLWHAAGEDRVWTHNAVPQEHFFHLQHECDVPPHHHRYEGGQLVEKTKIEITCDKHNIDVKTGVATVTWNAPEPVMININGVRSGPYNNSLPVHSSLPGVYMIEIDDPKYFSNSVVVNVEEPLENE